MLVEMITYLGYRWHPEYTVYEEYQDFNQEQYRAIVHLYSREYDSTTVLHTAHGVGVTIDMAVHDAAYAALTRLRGEYQELDTSPFRHIAIASDVGAEGYYTAAYSTVTREPFYHQNFVLHADGLDRANRALRHELYTTCQHLYRALTLLHPSVRFGDLPCQDRDAPGCRLARCGRLLSRTWSSSATCASGSAPEYPWTLGY